MSGPGLAERLADLRHDLGKYVFFEARFADAADAEDLRAALRADLYATRRAGARVEAAWEVWARLRPAELADHPDVRRVDAIMEELRAADLDAADRAALLRLRDLTREVAEATRRLAAGGGSWPTSS